MSKSRPSSKAKCPMCGQVPEDFGLKNHEPFVWNGMAGRYICEFCNLELAAEFYGEESRYFEMASRMLNLDVWECKKRYLEDIVNTSVAILPSAIGVTEKEFLAGRIEQCKCQITAIERYISVRNSSNDERVLHDALQELTTALAKPAFGAGYALPDLISVEFE